MITTIICIFLVFNLLVVYLGYQRQKRTTAKLEYARIMRASEMIRKGHDNGRTKIL